MQTVKLIIFFTLLSLTGWGCTNSLSTKERQGITFINSTKNPLVLSVFEVQTASQIDLEFSSTQVGVDTLNLLKVDEDTTVNKRDIYSLYKYRPVKNIRVFIGIVRNDSLFYKQSYTLTDNQLRKYKYQLKIQEDIKGNLKISR